MTTKKVVYCDCPIDDEVCNKEILHKPYTQLRVEVDDPNKCSGVSIVEALDLCKFHRKSLLNLIDIYMEKWSDTHKTRCIIDIVS